MCSGLLSEPDKQCHKGDAMLDMLLTNVSELTGDIRIGGCLNCSDLASLQVIPSCVLHPGHLRDGIPVREI